MISSYVNFGLIFLGLYLYIKNLLVPPSDNNDKITTNHSAYGTAVEVLARTLAGFLFGVLFNPVRNFFSGLREPYVGNIDYILDKHCEDPSNYKIIHRVHCWLDHWILLQFPVIAGYTVSHALLTLATREVENISILHIAVATLPAGFLVYWIKAFIGELMRYVRRAKLVRNHPQLDVGFVDELKDQFDILTDNLQRRDYLVTNLMEGVIAGGTIPPLFALGEFARQGKEGLFGLEVERVVGVSGWFFCRLLLNATIIPLVGNRCKKQTDLVDNGSRESPRWCQGNVKLQDTSEDASLSV